MQYSDLLEITEIKYMKLKTFQTLPIGSKILGYEGGPDPQEGKKFSDTEILWKAGDVEKIHKNKKAAIAQLKLLHINV